MMMKYSVCALVLAAALSSCKAGSLGNAGSLYDNETGTVDGKIDRNGDFQAISSLIQSAMFMIPYNTEETEAHFDYLRTAKDADKCQGDIEAAGCNEQLLELFATEDDFRAAAYTQQFFVNSNNTFRIQLESRTAYDLKNIVSFSQYADSTPDQDAVKVFQEQMSNQLQRSPLAEVTVVPTLHYDGAGAPKCFSYSVSVRKLNEDSIASMVISEEGYKFSPNQALDNTKILEVSDWSFQYDSGALAADPKSAKHWHNRYLVADFSNPFEARQELFFGLLNRTFDQGLQITQGTLPEDVSTFECNDENGECTFLKGKDHTGEGNCRLFNAL